MSAENNNNNYNNNNNNNNTPHPPFVTNSDHSAWIIVAASLGLALTLVFAGIRVFIRKIISPGVGLDDALLAVATVFSVVEASLLLGACRVGLGRSEGSLSFGDLDTVQQLYYAATLFFALGIGLSKASVAAFLLRIAPFNPHRKMVKITFALISVWTFALVFVLSLRCDLERPWRVSTAGCSDAIILRWEIVDAFGCLFELAMVGISIWLVWGVSALSWSQKAVVVVMFAFRLPVILFTVLRLLSYPDANRWDPTLLEAEFVSWSQAELGYSLIASTILVMRPFISNLVTHYAGSGKTAPRGDERAHLMLPMKFGSVSSPPPSDSAPSPVLDSERRHSEATLAKAVLVGGIRQSRQVSIV
ncbi:hypothetical protein AC578_8203 [Pseudocercospora eumusae]|uniref:Rhodopsin domain-containing protein n=1 Tax=Pseudocercospora eumusae TaxID=321146 RepID=A0A139HF05_9PEZI|nr:hypothetical protein AC578_8203 [Pseudocercospora eumusae]